MNTINNRDVTYTKKTPLLIDVSNNILDILDSDFILIIDMPHLLGGACFFLDVIISYFKKHVFFVVAKHINNSLHIIINNEYKLENNYNASNVSAL